MDPATMMAIANIGMQFLGKMGNNGGQQGQAPAQAQPQGQPPQPKPFMPGPIPAVNTTNYGDIVKQMMMQQQNPMPAMQGQGQSF